MFETKYDKSNQPCNDSERRNLVKDMSARILSLIFFCVVYFVFIPSFVYAGQSGKPYTYKNNISPSNKETFLNDYPQFVMPISAEKVFLAPDMIHDEEHDIKITAWFYSYAERGSIKVNHFLDSSKTALIAVHLWGVDDEGDNFSTPEPGGVVFFGTREKNKAYSEHLKQVLRPFIDNASKKLKFVIFSLPGKGDEEDGNDGLFSKMAEESTELTIDAEKMANSYINALGDQHSQRMPKKFWDRKIPLAKSIVAGDSKRTLFFDENGYDELKALLKKNSVKHVLIAGYALDLCVKTTAAGYENLGRDFNVFIVGDATLASFPVFSNPTVTTSAELARISLNYFITQISWIKF